MSDRNRESRDDSRPDPDPDPEQERDQQREHEGAPARSPWIEEERSWPGDVGAGDPALLAGDPEVSMQERGVALRCPRDGCDQTGWAPDYRQAHWPACVRHRVRMIVVDVGAE